MTPEQNILEKMANLPKILEAAKLLESFGLTHEKAGYYVRKYVEANPDINNLLKDFSWLEAKQDAQKQGE